MRSEGANIRVLIVDDHELVRVGLRTVLSADPEIDVVGDAPDGATAIALAGQQQPDVVLLDARLPDLDGAEVCRRLRAVVPGASVAMLTTFTDDELVRACVQAGAQGYLLKHIAQLDLGRSIKTLASGQPVFDPQVAWLVPATRRQAELVADPTPPLSTRQREVLQLVAQGLTNREIAVRMLLSDLTVKGYVEEILEQLGARNRLQAVILAMKRSWI